MQQLQSAITTHAFEIPKVTHTVIVFINSGSGGKQAEKIMDTGNQGKELNEIFSTYLYIFKINDSESRRMGLQFVNKVVKQSNNSLNKIVVMAGGGDGTVNWLLTQLISANVDYTKIAFGALPLGTGNDFAKNLGWTKVTLFDGIKGLKQFFTDINQSKFQEFDVWQIQVHHQQGGSIVQIHNGMESKIHVTPFIKQMTNYFSFGMDARVGYHFDKTRSNFQFLNLALYCLIGCCNRCKKIPSVEKVVSNMYQNESEDEMNLIFNSEKQKIHLKKFRHILALNINSYMGGVKGVWENSKQSGIKSKEFHPSNHSDGQLQFVAFQNQWSLGFQRIFKGRARKIAQGNGDFKLQFFENCIQTYLNFDGEYFKIYKPKTVIIRKSSYFKEQKLKIIRRTE